MDPSGYYHRKFYAVVGFRLHLTSFALLVRALTRFTRLRSSDRLPISHTLKTAQGIDLKLHNQLQLTARSSPRPISIIKLHPLPNFHRRPINLIVSEGSYLLLAVAILFSRGASRLDAFSVYPFRTSLPSRAIGMTTVAPEVRPSRSSRTRDSSHQNSCAHDG